MKYLILVMIVTLGACADTNFNRSGKTERGAAEDPNNPNDPNNQNGGNNQNGNNQNGNNPNGNDPNGNNQFPGINDPDDRLALGRCLKKMPNHPFNSSNFRRVKKLSAGISVFGLGRNIVDDEVTNEPQLILIGAGVNVLGGAGYDLRNPNGWYCFKVNVNVLARTNVVLHCRAKLVDSRVNVNVGSVTNDDFSRVGVNVGSFLRVIRPGC